MKIFFDTEFIDTGKVIDLISIGMVREDGKELYLESTEVNWDLADSWIYENVVPLLTNRDSTSVSRAEMRDRIIDFVGQEKPEFWAYYASYDWVCLCQLFGRMLDLPKGWPMYCNDLKWLRNLAGGIDLPEHDKNAHNALADARWTKEAWQQVRLACQSGIVLSPPLAAEG